MKLLEKTKGFRAGLIGVVSAVAMLGATVAPVRAFDELIELKIHILECAWILVFDNANHEELCGSGGPAGGLSWGGSGNGVGIASYSCSSGYHWHAGTGCEMDHPG